MPVGCAKGVFELNAVADASQDFDLAEALTNILELYGCNSAIEVERFGGRGHLEIMAQNLPRRPLSGGRLPSLLWVKNRTSAPGVGVGVVLLSPALIC